MKSVNRNERAERRIDLSRCKLLGPYGIILIESGGTHGIKMGTKPCQISLNSRGEIVGRFSNGSR